MILITKADGDLEITAKQSKQALKMAQNYRQWNSVDTIQTVSALDSTSVSHVLEVINRLYKEKIESGTLEEEQVRSRKFWIDQYFKDTLVKEVRSIDTIADKLKNDVQKDGISDELVFVQQFIRKNIIEKLTR